MLSAKDSGKEQPHRGVGGNTVGSSSSPDLPAAGTATVQPRQRAYPLPRKGGSPSMHTRGASRPCPGWTHTVVCESLHPMDCSPPVSSVHGILQATTLE